MLRSRIRHMKMLEHLDDIGRTLKQLIDFIYKIRTSVLANFSPSTFAWTSSNFAELTPNLGDEWGQAAAV